LPFLNTQKSGKLYERRDIEWLVDDTCQQVYDVASVRRDRQYRGLFYLAKVTSAVKVHLPSFGRRPYVQVNILVGQKGDPKNPDSDKEWRYYLAKPEAPCVAFVSDIIGQVSTDNDPAERSYPYKFNALNPHALETCADEALERKCLNLHREEGMRRFALSDQQPGVDSVVRRKGFPARIMWKEDS
jgi:hypothetical protein